MSGETHLQPGTILDTLRELAARVETPLWLFGGVAVDFLVGRWTRPHGDIDLNAFEEDRARLTRELTAIGYQTADTGWMTRWTQAATGREIEIVFLQRDASGGAVLEIRRGESIGIPGRYPMKHGYLDTDRWAELEGVRFRVSHPLGEWRARMMGSGVVASRAPSPKLEHDRRLLETLTSEAERRACMGDV